jgi:hypothetical protein
MPSNKTTFKGWFLVPGVTAAILAVSNFQIQQIIPHPVHSN